MSERHGHPAGDGGHRHDLAPGEEPSGRSEVLKGVRSYLLGYVIALALTVASFWVRAAASSGGRASRSR